MSEPPPRQQSIQCPRAPLPPNLAAYDNPAALVLDFHRYGQDTANWGRGMQAFATYINELLTAGVDSKFSLGPEGYTFEFQYRDTSQNEHLVQAAFDRASYVLTHCADLGEFVNRPLCPVQGHIQHPEPHNVAPLAYLPLPVSAPEANAGADARYEAEGVSMKEVESRNEVDNLTPEARREMEIELKEGSAQQDACREALRGTPKSKQTRSTHAAQAKRINDGMRRPLTTRASSDGRVSKSVVDAQISGAMSGELESVVGLSGGGIMSQFPVARTAAPSASESPRVPKNITNKVVKGGILKATKSVATPRKKPAKKKTPKKKAAAGKKVTTGNKEKKDDAGEGNETAAIDMAIDPALREYSVSVTQPYPAQGIQLQEGFARFPRENAREESSGKFDWRVGLEDPFVDGKAQHYGSVNGLGASRMENGYGRKEAAVESGFGGGAQQRVNGNGLYQLPMNHGYNQGINEDGLHHGFGGEVQQGAANDNALSHFHKDNGLGGLGLASPNAFNPYSGNDSSDFHNLQNEGELGELDMPEFFSGMQQRPHTTGSEQLSENMDFDFSPMQQGPSTTGTEGLNGNMDFDFGDAGYGEADGSEDQF